MGKSLQLLAMDQTHFPMICEHCKAAAESLSSGESRVGDLVITKELLLNMLNLQDAKCLSFRVDELRDVLILRVIQTGPKPGIWFQDVDLHRRAEGTDYHQILVKEE